jgi:hypothetical protein
MKPSIAPTLESTAPIGALASVKNVSKERCTPSISEKLLTHIQTKKAQTCKGLGFLVHRC